MRRKRATKGTYISMLCVVDTMLLLSSCSGELDSTGLLISLGFGLFWTLFCVLNIVRLSK